ncbi:hypothetical protein M0R45_030866 [Rubus argutus]|uniref:Uncharacterized protein n=1 Tax=Rubus argutus TaxID=59490 RepID=A0AAW1WES5_RUBAR
MVMDMTELVEAVDGAEVKNCGFDCNWHIGVWCVYEEDKGHGDLQLEKRQGGGGGSGHQRSCYHLAVSHNEPGRTTLSRRRQIQASAASPCCHDITSLQTPSYPDSLHMPLLTAMKPPLPRRPPLPSADLDLSPEPAAPVQNHASVTVDPSCPSPICSANPRRCCSSAIPSTSLSSPPSSSRRCNLNLSA